MNLVATLTFSELLLDGIWIIWKAERSGITSSGVMIYKSRVNEATVATPGNGLPRVLAVRPGLVRRAPLAPDGAHSPQAMNEDSRLREHTPYVYILTMYIHHMEV